MDNFAGLRRGLYLGDAHRLADDSVAVVGRGESPPAEAVKMLGPVVGSNPEDARRRAEEMWGKKP